MRITQLSSLFAAGLGALAFTVTTVGAAHAAGALKGTVTLKGKAPESKELNMKSDPFCAKQGARKEEEVMVGSGGALKNVVVRIAKGVTNAPPAPAKEAVLDQVGCMYTPRVVAVQGGQPVHIKNSDQTLHNVHTYKGPATLFNQAQPQGMPPLKKKFPTPGDVIKFKCDVHPWMTAYVLVTDNPYFQVTGENGQFDIANIPPGKYTVEAWHEKLGTQTKDITVADGKPVELKIEFAAK
jgi:plastocyanin